VSPGERVLGPVRIPDVPEDAYEVVRATAKECPKDLSRRGVKDVFRRLEKREEDEEG
jgi:hypothetical protein